MSDPYAETDEWPTPRVDTTGHPGATDAFVRPCLDCGATMRVVGGVEHPHEHTELDNGDSLAAYAWWQGCDAAREAVNVPAVSGARGDAEGAREARYAEAMVRAIRDYTELPGADVMWNFSIVKAADIQARAVMAVADEEQAALRERMNAAIDRARMERALAEDAETAATERALAAEDRLRKVAGALSTLVMLKDGPRDSAYYANKEAAWERARAVLAAPPAAPEAAEPGPCVCGHALSDHLDGLACYAGTTVTSEFACDCGEYRPAPVSSGEAATGEAAV